MEFMISSNMGILALVCAVICAKWAMDLGSSQVRQIIWFVGGLLLGPVAMLILYVRLLSVAPAPAQRWVP